MIVYDSTVSERYALALFNVSKKQGSLDGVKHDAEQLLELLKKDSKLAVFLEGPQFTTESKLALLKKLFSGKLNPVVFQLLDILVKKGRIEYARPILTRFVALAEEDQGIRQADIASAQPLSDDQRSKVLKALEAHTKSKLRLTYHVEPALIGGLRFTMGDLLIDDSVKGKLDRLKYRLQEATR